MGQRGATAREAEKKEREAHNGSGSAETRENDTALTAREARFGPKVAYFIIQEGKKEERCYLNRKNFLLDTCVFFLFFS